MTQISNETLDFLMAYVHGIQKLCIDDHEEGFPAYGPGERAWYRKLSAKTVANPLVVISAL